LQCNTVMAAVHLFNNYSAINISFLLLVRLIILGKLTTEIKVLFCYNF